jgi:hypothetical protein
MRHTCRSPWVVLVFVGLTWNVSVAQEEPGSADVQQIRHEACFGLGPAIAFEDDLLNVPGEEKVKPDIGISLAYRYYVSEEFAFGLHMFGYTAKTPPYDVVDKSGTSKTASFTFGALNVGIQGRYMPIRGTVTPYLFATLSAALGSVDDPGTGTLQYYGVTFGGGLGVAFFLSSHVALSVEGSGVYGTAKWKEKPFQNSTSDDLNPSMIGLFVSVSYCWSD